MKRKGIKPPRYGAVGKHGSIAVVEAHPDDDAATRKALEMGARDGLVSMKKLLPTIAPVRNGWQMNTETMGVYGLTTKVCSAHWYDNLPRAFVFRVCRIQRSRCESRPPPPRASIGRCAVSQAIQRDLV